MRPVTQAQLDRPLVSQWLQRELQAILLQDDVVIIAQHILGSLNHVISDQISRNSGQRVVQARLEFPRAVEVAVAAASPYLPDYATKLGQELIKFVISGLNIDAYDSMVFHLHKEEDAVERALAGAQQGSSGISSSVTHSSELLSPGT